MRRLTILLAAVGALLLVPAAQALASTTATVNIAGNGNGEVNGEGGFRGEEGEKTGFYEGTPPIACSYVGATETKSGVCEDEFSEGEEFMSLLAIPAPGYKFAGWVVEEGLGAFGCSESERLVEVEPWQAAMGYEPYDPNPQCLLLDTGSGHVEVTAIFAKAQLLTVSKSGSGSGRVDSKPVGSSPIECGKFCTHRYPEGSEVTLTERTNVGSVFAGWTGCDEVVAGECKVTMSEAKNVTAKFSLEGEGEGPTNLRTLTLTKSGNGPGGTGSVSSKPKGIKCGTTCTEALAAEYKSTPVTLTEKPGGESTFVEWTGACSGSSPTCTVPMAEDEAVGAVFAGVSKTITPAEALTLSKGESTGKGTVKAAGLGCEAECTSTTVLYQGPITEPKAKPGKVVILKQAPAFGSTFSGWSGCDSVDGEGNCVVEMDEAHSVSAEYTALPNKALTVNKPYSTGNGSVSSKPKGIKCASACTQAVAQMPEGASVELTAKPGTETTFVHWVGGDCGGSTNPVCTVTMNADETTEAVFSKASKALAGESEATLTLNKAGSGFGTVKAAGLGCEWLCTSTSVVYQGPITEPKAKPGKVVVLKALSAPGSKKVVWSGCDSEDAEGNCVIEMDEDHTVSATFDELE